MAVHIRNLKEIANQNKDLVLSVYSDDDDKIESESKLNNNHLYLEPDPLNKTIEFNSEMKNSTEEQLENCEDVTQKETTVIEHKTLDETNEDSIEKENILTRSNTMEESKITKVTFKVNDDNLHEVEVESDDVFLDEVVTENKVDCNSLYKEYAEGHEMKVEDMVTWKHWSKNMC